MPSAAAARAPRRPGPRRAAQRRASRRSRRPPSRCAPASLPRPRGGAPARKSRASAQNTPCRPRGPPAPRRAPRGPPRPPGRRLGFGFLHCRRPPAPRGRRARTTSGVPSLRTGAVRCARPAGGSGAGPGAVPAARGPPAAQAAVGRGFGGGGGRSSRRRAPAAGASPRKRHVPKGALPSRAPTRPRLNPAPGGKNPILAHQAPAWSLEPAWSLQAGACRAYSIGYSIGYSIAYTIGPDYSLGYYCSSLRLGYLNFKS